jgi:hypothetical protein
MQTRAGAKSNQPGQAPPKLDNNEARSTSFKLQPKVADEPINKSDKNKKKVIEKSDDSAKPTIVKKFEEHKKLGEDETVKKGEEVQAAGDTKKLEEPANPEEGQMN